MRILAMVSFFTFSLIRVVPLSAQTTELNSEVVFDDTRLIDGYKKKYQQEPLSILLAMIRDDALNPLKATAAIEVFIEQYSERLFSKDKVVAIKTLLRRLNRTDSPFVQVATMHALCRVDRYQYFKPLVPALILKVDHYDHAVSALAAMAMDDIISKGSDKAWEARIVFGTLRKIFFLSRNKLTNKENPALQAKIKQLRWAIKILGSQELNSLPKEVIPLL